MSIRHPEASERRLTVDELEVRTDEPFGEAVGIGDLPRAEDPEALAAAVRAADAESLADRLPEGMGTLLGRELGGIDLSEGQWQRAALARGSMRRNPLFFVLDEPTASLDAHSEEAVFRRYMERARAHAARTGAVTLIVSHRFSTVAGADLVLVMDRGRVVESGTHPELMALDGRYAELCGIQARAYAPARTDPSDRLEGTGPSVRNLRSDGGA